jgi:hypothetical protein
MERHTMTEFRTQPDPDATISLVVDLEERHTMTRTTVKTSTLLRRARKLIKDPRNWTQNTLRRTDKRSPAGQRCCAIGAVRAVTPSGLIEGAEMTNALHLLHSCALDLFHVHHIAALNDGTPDHGSSHGTKVKRSEAHARTITAFNCAIKKAAAAEKAAG